MDHGNGDVEIESAQAIPISTPRCKSEVSRAALATGCRCPKAEKL